MCRVSSFQLYLDSSIQICEKIDTKIIHHLIFDDRNTILINSENIICTDRNVMHDKYNMLACQHQLFVRIMSKCYKLIHSIIELKNSNGNEKRGKKSTSIGSDAIRSQFSHLNYEHNFDWTMNLFIWRTFILGIKHQWVFVYMWMCHNCSS